MFQKMAAWQNGYIRNIFVNFAVKISNNLASMFQKIAEELHLKYFQLKLGVGRVRTLNGETKQVSWALSHFVNEHPHFLSTCHLIDKIWAVSGIFMRN